MNNKTEQIIIHVIAWIIWCSIITGIFWMFGWTPHRGFSTGLMGLFWLSASVAAIKIYKKAIAIE